MADCGDEPSLRAVNGVLLAVARPVGDWPAGTTAGAEPRRAAELSEFHPERRGNARSDEFTAVAGVVARSSEAPPGRVTHSHRHDRTLIYAAPHRRRVYPERRFWSVVAVAGLGASLALLTRAPQYVLATAGVCGWLLVAQALAVRAFARVDRSLTVAQTVTPRVAVRGGTVQLRVEATLDEPQAVAVTCTATIPPSVRAQSPGGETVSLTVPPGETSASATRELQSDTAGRVSFAAPSVAVAGPCGLFGTRLDTAATAELTVEPATPRDVRIGRGTDRPTSSFGVHGGGEIGTGLDPAELREYVSGDPRRYIDWNATARRDGPYVREYEPSADAEFAVVFDHGPGMDVGPPGQTMLAFLRDVALDTVAAAAARTDPVGLYAVDGDGVARRHRSTTTVEGYRQITEAVNAIEADGSQESASVDTPDIAVDRRTSQQRADRLGAGAEGAFAARLRPLVEPRASVVGRAADAPLLGVVRSLRPAATAETHVVVFTNDRDRATTYDAVELAARTADQVTVFVTPTVLFEPDALADLDDAAARYRSFETFRGHLDGIASVRAFEVAPGDRLEALLQTQARTRQQSARVGGGQ